MSDKQKTIKRRVSVSGKGLHTGNDGTLTLVPAPENHGIKFKRVDLAGQPVVDAHINNVVATDRGTTLGLNGYKIYTIEHVLAALTGMGVDNVLIEMDMEEIPIKDGSSKYFVEAIEEAGIVEQNALKEYIDIKEKITYEIPEKKIKLEVEPADRFSVTVVIDYDSRVLGQQVARLVKLEDFKVKIAPCRTFVFLHELEFLMKNNLIKGGDLNNAIVFVNKKVSQEELDYLADLFKKPRVKVKKEGILNNLELYFDNEPARHKLLDVIGDLSLLGKNIKGHVTAYRPGHKVNTEFAKEIYNHINNYAYDKRTTL